MTESKTYDNKYLVPGCDIKLYLEYFKFGTVKKFHKISDIVKRSIICEKVYKKDKFGNINEDFGRADIFNGLRSILNNRSMEIPIDDSDLIGELERCLSVLNLMGSPKIKCLRLIQINALTPDSSYEYQAYKVKLMSEDEFKILELMDDYTRLTGMAGSTPFNTNGCIDMTILDNFHSAFNIRERPIYGFVLLYELE